MTNETYYPGDDPEYRGFKIHLSHDDVECDPRKDFDHLGTMCCVHKQYRLGDGDMSLLYQELSADPRWKDSYDDPDSRYYVDPDDYGRLLELAERWSYEILPLYLYDHSGLAMSTGTFYCPWDSGQVGVIFISTERMKQEYGVDQLTNVIHQRARNALRMEVKEYDTYLQGDVWCVSVEDEAGEWVDSLCGLYGLEYASEEARSMADAYLEQREKDQAGEREQRRRRHLQQVKTWIRNRVPLEVRQAADQKEG